MVTYKDKNILIDCGPDFRQQMLECGSPMLEALMITHSHYDHVGGVDDLRPYCAMGINSWDLYVNFIDRTLKLTKKFRFKEINVNFADIYVLTHTFQ